MNKIEPLLGITIVLCSILSILFINLGVVPSHEYPGHYTYGFPAGVSVILSILSFITGFVAIVHAIHKNCTLQFGLGIIVIIWGFFAWQWVGLSLYDASPYIKSYPTSVTETWHLLIPGIFLGIALTLDGITETKKILTKANQPPS